MPKTLIAETASLNSSLLAFKPRQVLLFSTTTSAMKPDHKAQLLRSIAGFLDRSGFSKTLKKFRSEAKLEKDDLGMSSYDLEQVFCKFLDSCDDAGKKLASKKTEALQVDDTSKGDGDVESASAVETIKTKKKNIRSDDASKASEKIMASKDAKETKKHEAHLDAKPKESKQYKRISDSVGQEESKNSEIVHEVPDKKHKEKKKRKNKLDSESQINNDEHHPSELLSEASKGRLEDRKVVDSETKAEQKEKKTKNSSNTSLDNIEQDGLEAKQDELMGKQKEGSKKRKRSASEKDAEQPADKKVVEESKRRKTEVSEEAERNGHVDSGSSKKVPGKEFDAQANGNLENEGENSAIQKTTKKQQNGSAEPHTVKRFQRVKVDEVVFSDERLKDNSYWAKNGAETGYGAKAEEVLGQVKGRGFRHEKTKKKRGSYRGGQIDLQSHSIKFNYSDDD